MRLATESIGTNEHRLGQKRQDTEGAYSVKTPATIAQACRVNSTQNLKSSALFMPPSAERSEVTAGFRPVANSTAGLVNGPQDTAYTPAFALDQEELTTPHCDGTSLSVCFRPSTDSQVADMVQAQIGGSRNSADHRVSKPEIYPIAVGHSCLAPLASYQKHKLTNVRTR